VEKKQIQALKTSRAASLLGCPLNLYDQGRTELIRKMLEVGGQVMVSKHPAKYPSWQYGPDAIPEFADYEDYLENTPFVPREADEKVSSWQKKVIIVECNEGDEEEILTRLNYCLKSGLM
jgi:hypothetical protein